MIVPDLDTCKEKALPVVKVFHWNCQSLTPRLKIHICLISRHSWLQFNSVQSLSHVQFFVTLWTAARQASLSVTSSRSLPKLRSIESVMPSNHLILCRPLLLLPPILPSIRVFSNESALRIRWPKYWSFSFNISSSNEHSGLTSFRMDLGMNIQRQSRS